MPARKPAKPARQPLRAPKAASAAPRAKAKPKAPKRPARDADSTRARLLEAARRLFSRKSYADVGLREIAKAAGVDAALVVRYFGGKDGIFVEALTGNANVDKVLTGAASPADIARNLAEKITCGPEDMHDGFDPLPALMRSLAHPKAAALLREGVQREVVRPLAAALGGPDAELRAALIVSSVLGIALGREIIEFDAFTKATPEALQAMILPIMAPLTGPAHSMTPAPPR